MSVLRGVAAASALMALGVAVACSSFESTDSPRNDDGGASDSSTPVEDATNDGGATDGSTTDAATPKHVYIYGGYPDMGGAKANDQAWSAEVLADGGLGEWKRVPELDSPRYFGANAVTDTGRIVFAGGTRKQDNDSGFLEPATTSVETASLSPLTKMKQAAPLPMGVGSLAGTASGPFIIVGGGQTNDDQSSLKTIYVTSFDTNGALLAWSNGGLLPENLAFPGFVAVDGRLFVIGGVNVSDAGNIVSDKAVRAPIATDGGIGQWKTTGALPEPLWVHATVVARGRIYAIGGRSGVDGTATGAVRYTSIDTNGELSWQTTTPLPGPVVAGCAVAAGDMIFVMGGFGMSANVPTTTVYVGTVGGSGSVDWSETTPLPVGAAGAGCAIY